MWSCKHCKNEFLFERATEKANHSRYCNKNPKKQELIENVRLATSSRHNDKFGEVKIFKVQCNCCSKVFEVNEREKLHPQKSVYFCSRSCANSTGGKARAKKYHSDSKAHYRTVAFRYRDKHCYACGHNRILEVHHVDENHDNNEPSNLIPLCPTHHKMMHSRWKNEVIDLLKNKTFWGK